MSTINHIVTQMLGARMQAAEKTLDLADATDRSTEQGSLRRYSLLTQATADLDALRDLMSEHLEHQTEWQVSAFHDQYNALRNRLGATVTNA